MGDRKLATIQRITALEPIPGRDRIVLASILGWKVVVGKGDFSTGDLCVFFEVDSLLPPIPEFEFLRSRCWSEKQQGFRIKTMKLGETYSQGLALPLSILNPPGAGEPIWSNFNEGNDVTEWLGVKKYLNPEELEQERAAVPPHRFERMPSWLRKLLWKTGLFGGHRKRVQVFPSGIYKTDETRLQAMPQILDGMAGKVLYATEKLDGCSATFFARPVNRSLGDRLLGRRRIEFGVCSRNIRLWPGQSELFNKGAYWEMARKHELEQKLSKIVRDFGGEGVAIQGEIIGPGIQGNKYGLSEKRLFVYQIQDLERGAFVDYDMLHWLAGQWGLDLVPDVPLPDSPITSGWGVDEWVLFSQGCSVLNPETPREGLVVRTTEDERAPGLHLPTVAQRLSFKVVNPFFLVKYDL